MRSEIMPLTLCVPRYAAMHCRARLLCVFSPSFISLAANLNLSCDLIIAAKPHHAQFLPRTHRAGRYATMATATTTTTQPHAKRRSARRSDSFIERAQERESQSTMSPTTQVTEEAFALRSGLVLKGRLWVSSLLPDGTAPHHVGLGLHGWQVVSTQSPPSLQAPQH